MTQAGGLPSRGVALTLGPRAVVQVGVLAVAVAVAAAMAAAMAAAQSNLFPGTAFY